MLAELDKEELEVDKDSVLVLRNHGPVGMGMPEWGSIPIPRKLLNQGVRDMVRISDARMSGTSYGTVILHVSPESQAGGPLAAVRDGDWIEVDIERGILHLDIPEKELASRMKDWRPVPSPHARGYMRLFAEHVLQAHEGCDMGREPLRGLQRRFGCHRPDGMGRVPAVEPFPPRR